VLGVAACLVLFATGGLAANDELRIGSKKFTESVILADIAVDLGRAEGGRVVHRQELGGTRILWDALLAGTIDLYPEYTGTLINEILAGEAIANEAELTAALARRGIRMSRSLGFSDTYALAVLPGTADRLKIARISDLVAHPTLRLGFSNEFLNRADGWPALRDAYGLPAHTPTGLDHDLAYRALADGSIDVIDVYTTDAEIASYGLRILDDDRRHFPVYDAVFLYRADLFERRPDLVRAILRLEGRIDVPAMIAMNAAVRNDRRSETAVAAAFVERQFGLLITGEGDSVAVRVWQRTLEHLTLTLISLSAAIVVALPLGIIAAYRPRVGRLILGVVSVIQTIPSLALLVFMIPVLGIGAPTAIVALFLYSLLPIVRNTATGLSGITPPIRDAAIALGLTSWRRLIRVELPMASPSILAGIKTAAIINIGTATLGALIGAGGYGQPILTGIRLDNFALILEGAVPAALMALAAEGLFDLAGLYMIPRGLRLKRSIRD